MDSARTRSVPGQSPGAGNIAGEETRNRLIAAATEVFLADGLRAARVQEIARRAGARLSAINYHFGGKDGLYEAVLRHHAALAVQQMPLASPEPDQPPRARFDFAIRALVGRMLDVSADSRIGPLMLREMVSPTPALDLLIQQFTRPQAEQLRAIVDAVLGDGVPRIARARALLSIFGQCAVYITGRPLITRLFPEALTEPPPLDAIARHVADFSWAGLMALRQESGPVPDDEEHRDASPA